MSGLRASAHWPSARSGSRCANAALCIWIHIAAPNPMERESSVLRGEGHIPTGSIRFSRAPSLMQP